MKKTRLIILTLSLIISIFSTMGIGVGAANINTIGESESQSIKGTFVQGAFASVYSVDIAWGSLEFTYTEGSKGTWNTETYVYDNPSEGVWSCANDENKVTVTNHSNDGILASFDFTANSEYTDVDVEFFYDSDFTHTMADSNEIYLNTAEAHQLNTSDGLIDVLAGARIKSSYIKISSGELESGNNVVIGEVTVTINDTSGIG